MANVNVTFDRLLSSIVSKPNDEKPLAISLPNEKEYTLKTLIPIIAKQLEKAEGIFDMKLYRPRSFVTTIVNGEAIDNSDVKIGDGTQIDFYFKLVVGG